MVELAWGEQPLFDDEEDDAPACVSCSCTRSRACDPPCTWQSFLDIPLCSSCAPPLILVAGVDVDDEVLALAQRAPGICTADVHYALADRVPVDEISAALHRLLDEDLVYIDDAGGVRARSDRRRAIE